MNMDFIVPSGGVLPGKENIAFYALGLYYDFLSVFSKNGLDFHDYSTTGGKTVSTEFVKVTVGEGCRSVEIVAIKKIKVKGKYETSGDLVSPKYEEIDDTFEPGETVVKREFPTAKLGTVIAFTIY